MTLWNETKSVPISKDQVWSAYKLVRANKGGAGVDGISMAKYEANCSEHLYKLWNRMASGSYFPPAVKEVEIPKDDGKIRKLGVPTISDRVAQMVVKMHLEPRFEKIFSPNSYGYRPNKSAHQALAAVRENCWKTAWVIDLDIKGFFDNINHEKLILALERHVSEKWTLMYIKRWLTAPIEKETGELEYKEGKGTPQGGVISPLLANLFLHYAFDKWLEQEYPTVKFVRYADDAIIHCTSQSQAEHLLAALHQRMSNCDLALHPDKTKLVYCRDYKRRGTFKTVKFDFLSFSFQPRETKSKHTGRLFLGYDCAISISSRKRLNDKIKAINFVDMRFKSIVGLAQKLNPLIRGWINYFGKFRMSELSKVFYLLRCRLVRWIQNRYKRYRYNLNKAYACLDRIRKQYPTLFYHWQVGYN